MEIYLNELEKIVKDVLSDMGNGIGRARSEDLLFFEVLERHKNLIERQPEIREAISSLIGKGIIVHDEYPSYCIHLEI